MGLILDEVLQRADVSILANKIRDYSEELFNHSYNVALYTEDVIEHSCPDLDITFKEDIVVGAFLHDIGKTRIDKNILYKDGVLTEEEFNIVKNHTNIDGMEEMENFSNVVKKICRMHHEKRNAEGYPKHAEDIPFYVQIVTVVDIFTALIEKRCYKDPMSGECALAILKQEVVKGGITEETKKMLERVCAMRGLGVC